MSADSPKTFWSRRTEPTMIGATLAYFLFPLFALVHFSGRSQAMQETLNEPYVQLLFRFFNWIAPTVEGIYRIPLGPYWNYWALGQGAWIALVIPPFLIAGFLWLVGFDIIKAFSPPPRSTSHGSGRYATRSEQKLFMRGSRTSLLIGANGKRRFFHYDGPEHLLTLAPTRSGKGASVIIPNLLHVDRSVIVIDPKGENVQVVTRALQDIERTRVKPKSPVLFLLDEFASVGDMHAIKTAFGLMAGYGLQLWAFLQNWGQLEELYGKGAHTFVANAGVFQAFNTNDELTARYVSNLSGDSTRAETVGRKLLTPEEVMHLKPTTIFLKLKGVRPFFAAKVQYWTHRRFRRLHDKSDFN